MINKGKNNAQFLESPEGGNQKSNAPFNGIRSGVQTWIALAFALTSATALAKDESLKAEGQANNFDALYITELANSGEAPETESKINLAELSPKGVIEAFNPDNSVIIFNDKVLLFPNDVASSTYENGANLDVNMYTKNGEKPMNYFEYPLSVLGERIAPTAQDISYNINWESSLELEWWATISIEDGKLVVKWLLERNERVEIKVLSQEEELWKIELFVKASSWTENYNAWNNAVVDLNTKASNSVKISRRNYNDGEPAWEYTDTIRSAFELGERNYASVSLNTEISNAWVNLNRVSKATSLSSNYEVEMTNWEVTIKTTNWKNPNIPTRIRSDDDGKTEIYVDYSAYALPKHTTEEIVPIELTLDDWTKSIVNVRIKKLPAMETDANEQHVDISLQNQEWSFNATVDWLRVEHNWDGKWYTVQMNIWDFIWPEINTSYVSNGGFINKSNSYNMAVSLNWCEDLRVDKISENSETSNYEVTMTCWKDIIEWTTTNFSWNLEIIPNTASNTSFEVPMSLSITAESQNNSLKITPSSENPTKQITDPKDPIVLEYSVEGNFEIDEDSLPEGFSCRKVEGTDNIKIEIDYISILENNTRWDYSIKWVCNLVSLDNQNRVTSIFVNKELYFTPSAESVFNIWQVGANFSTNQSFTSNNSSPYVLKERLAPWHTLKVWDKIYTSDFEGNIVVPANSKITFSATDLWDTEGKNIIEYEWLVSISYEVVLEEKSSVETFTTLDEECWEYQSCTSGPILKVTYPTWVDPEQSTLELTAKDAQWNTFNASEFFKIVQEVTAGEDWTHIGTFRIESKGDILPSSMIDWAKENLWLYVSLSTADWVNYNSDTPAVNLTLYWEAQTPPRVMSGQSITIIGQSFNSVRVGQEYTAEIQMTSGLNPNNPNLNIWDLIKNIILVDALSSTNQEIWKIVEHEILSEDSSKIRVTFKVTSQDSSNFWSIQIETNNVASEIDEAPANEKATSFSSAFFGITR